MTQYEGADGTHVPQSTASRPAFRFNGYGVPVDADPPEPDLAPDEDSPYRYDAYGPRVDPYVDSVPYDEPVDPYVRSVPYDEPADPYVEHVPYDEPVDPYVANIPYDEPAVARAQPEPGPVEPQPRPAEPAESPVPLAPAARAEPAWSPPTPEPEPEPAEPEPTAPEPAAPEPEPVFAARLEPVVEARPERPAAPTAPAREPAGSDASWRAQVPVMRFEPERPEPAEPEPRPVRIGSAVYAEPYVHAYVAAEAPVDALARPAPAAWPPPARRGAPARARTDEPAVVARPAYRPVTHAPAHGADEARERTWALVSHIGGLLTGFLVPLVTFLAYRKRSQFLREHTTEALNFQLMLTIVYVAGAALTVLFFGVFVLAAAWVFAVTFGTLGALAANDGDRFRYPVNLRVIA